MVRDWFTLSQWTTRRAVLRTGYERLQKTAAATFRRGIVEIGASIMPRGLLVSLVTSLLVTAWLVAAPAATAAQLIGRNAENVHLAVDASGVALVTFSTDGTAQHVLARGAINADPPSTSKRQVQFDIDYAGGMSFFGHEVWQSFDNACKPYDGPVLYAAVAECTAPDGSYWALQSWQEPLPDLGFTPWLPQQSDYWLELSHWSGPVAQLAVYQGWVYGQRYRALVGEYTYKGEPIHGFGTTATGRPTDTYGRLLYLDTFDSAYGAGWRRANSFVSHNPSGAFCYGFFPIDPTMGGYEYPAGWHTGDKRAAGFGTQYRIIASGPGVTPLVSWEGDAIGAYDGNDPSYVIHDLETTQLVRSFGSKLCLKGLTHTPPDKLANLHDDFLHPLSTLWDAPQTTGGATLNSSAQGLVATLPNGSQSTAELDSASNLWDRFSSPAFVDLGPTGIPANASFELLLHPSLGPTFSGVTQIAGLRIADGQLTAIGRYGNPPRFNGTTWVPQGAVNNVYAATPYSSPAMRWLWLWERNRKFEVWYAGDVAGPWTELGTIPDFFSYDSHVQLQIRFEGEGDSDAQVVLKSLSTLPTTLSAATTGPPIKAPARPSPVPPPPPPPAPAPAPSPLPASTIWTEQASIHHPVHTFSDYHNASGQGPDIATAQNVQVSCKVYDPTIVSVNPDGYWYRIASSPWNNAYYAPANTFMNGDPPNGPYTHNTDFAVADCSGSSAGPPAAAGPTVALAQGPVAPFGYRYTVTVSGFSANTSVAISCRDSVDPGGFFTFDLETNTNGSASVSDECYSADGPDHWVIANGTYESNHVTWGSGTSAPASPSPTPPSAPAPKAPPHLWIVTLGDSYTAGNGAGANYDSCHRSYNSYAWLYMNRLRGAGYSADIWQAACSGATTADVFGQITSVLSSPANDPDLVFLTIGGNDLNFHSIVEWCLLPVSGNVLSVSNCTGLLDTAIGLLGTTIDTTRSILQDVANKMPNAQIVLVGYPVLTNPTCPNTPWNQTIAAAESAIDADQSTMVTALDRTEGTSRFHFISIAQTFSGHGPCAAANDQYVRGVDVTIDGNWPSYHPNLPGNQAIADLLFSKGVQNWIP
jgi:lysophospholipase L1-like esterase